MFLNKLLTKQGGMALSLFGIITLILAAGLLFTARTIQSTQGFTFTPHPAAVGFAFGTIAAGATGAILTATGLAITAWRILSQSTTPN